MASVVRCCVLLLSICFSRLSSLPSFDTVMVLKGDHGKNINIQCATDKTPQDGVYMIRKKLNESEQQEVFYYYKDGTLKEKINVKVTIHENHLPKLTATLKNLTVADIGLYWCEFHLEEKRTNSSATFLWVTEKHETILHDEKNCQAAMVLYVMIALLAIILFILGFLCVKMKRSRESDTPSKKSQGSSIYEEMTKNRRGTTASL